MLGSYNRKARRISSSDVEGFTGFWILRLQESSEPVRVIMLMAGLTRGQAHPLKVD